MRILSSLVLVTLFALLSDWSNAKNPRLWVYILVMYIQVEVFNSTPTQTRGFYANVVIPSFFFHFTSVFAARRRNTKNNGSTFRETNSTSGAWRARKSKLNLQFVFAPLACVLSALLALFCFRFRFNYLGIYNKILDAKFFVRSYNLQHVFLFSFLIL